MKKTQHIIIIFFLLGMLFTVFQYLPFLEEEAPGHRTELAKKAKESDNTNGDDSGDDDSANDDDDVKTNMFHDHFNAYSFNRLTGNDFYIKAPLYQSLVKNINTPPPKA